MNKNERHNWYLTRGKTAILIDGGFFLKRLKSLDKQRNNWDTDYVVKMIQILCVEHAAHMEQQIYRVFYYDCPPFDLGIHNPLSGDFVKFNTTSQYLFKTELFEKLRSMRKMALRLGRISLNASYSWQIKPSKIHDLLTGKITVKDLDPEKDILPSLQQKQVDIKIGVDIASMALKHQVESIVLVAGDGDFVPASKLARREGVDFILDPMWAHIKPDLKEHVDGIRSVLFNLKDNKSKTESRDQHVKTDMP